MNEKLFVLPYTSFSILSPSLSCLFFCSLSLFMSDSLRLSSIGIQLRCLYFVSLLLNNQSIKNTIKASGASRNFSKMSPSLPIRSTISSDMSVGDPSSLWSRWSTRTFIVPDYYWPALRNSLACVPGSVILPFPLVRTMSRASHN